MTHGESLARDEQAAGDGTCTPLPEAVSASRQRELTPAESFIEPAAPRVNLARSRWLMPSRGAVTG